MHLILFPLYISLFICFYILYISQTRYLSIRCYLLCKAHVVGGEWKENKKYYVVCVAIISCFAFKFKYVCLKYTINYYVLVRWWWWWWCWCWWYVSLGTLCCCFYTHGVSVIRRFWWFSASQMTIIMNLRAVTNRTGAEYKSFGWILIKFRFARMR